MSSSSVLRQNSRYYYYGSPQAVVWLTISFGHGRPEGSIFSRRTSADTAFCRLIAFFSLADRSLPLHHQSNTCVHTIGMGLFPHDRQTCPCLLSLHILVKYPIASTPRRLYNTVLCWAVFVSRKHCTST